MRVLDSTKKEEIKNIYFGKVKAGDSKEVLVYLVNDSKAILTNLFYEFPGLPPGEIIEVVSAPVTIQPGQTEPLKVKWSPSLKFKQALEVGLEISGEEVYTSAKLSPIERREKE